MARQDLSHGHRVPWFAAVGTLGAVTAALACRPPARLAEIMPPLSPTLPLIGTMLLSAVAVITGLAASTRPVVTLHRVGCLVGGGVWASAVAWRGWTAAEVVWLAVGAVAMAVLTLALPRDEAATVAAVGPDGMPDRRPREVRDLEALLRELDRRPIRVTDVRPWDDPRDGRRAWVDLPRAMTVSDLATLSARIAGGLHLPPGCVVQVRTGDHQGQAILDIMLRDCLVDPVPVDGATTEASITDAFPLVHDARGNPIMVCLRLMSAVIGGAPDTGKTTLLRRIILQLARCTDTLVWVVDLNGGGLAEPFVTPWAQGRAAAPAVDWVAGDEVEGAILLATAQAIIRDRKRSGEAIRRKRAANSAVLPVDRQLPAIVVLTDEGGEVRQAAGLLGRLCAEGISRFAQIGRAEGGRAVISVLKGTADLLDRGLKVVAPMRVCLGMTEDAEYSHVLGVDPPRGTALQHKGSCWIVPGMQQPLTLARSSDVPIDLIERHTIATARLRPRLDERAQRVAAKLSISDVLGGRDPRDHVDIARDPAMRDVAAGRAYEGRWDRAGALLAEMRGEEPPAPTAPAPEPRDDRPTVAPPGSHLERLLLRTGVTRQDPPEPPAPPAATSRPAPRRVDLDPAAVVREAAELLSSAHLLREVPDPVRTRTGAPDREPTERAPAARMTTRDHIRMVLRDAAPEAMTGAQVVAALADAGVERARQTVYDLLGKLAEASGEPVRRDSDRYWYQLD
jgi:hypothetical protein